MLFTFMFSRFTKFDRIVYKQQLKKGINPYVSAARGLVLNTFYTLLIILAIFIVLQLLGEVAFFVLKRFDLIRTVKQYTLKDEINDREPPDETKNTHSPTRQVGRLKIPDAISKKCGSVRGVRPGWHLEYKPEVAKELQKKKDKGKEKKKKEKEKKEEEKSGKDEENSEEIKLKEGKMKDKEKQSYENGKGGKKDVNVNE